MKNKIQHIIIIITREEYIYKTAPSQVTTTTPETDQVQAPQTFS